MENSEMHLNYLFFVGLFILIILLLEFFSLISIGFDTEEVFIFDQPIYILFSNN